MGIQFSDSVRRCCVGMIFLVFITTGCQSDVEALDVINISNTPGRSEFPAIAADSRGYFYVVWEERAPNGILDIYISERPLGGDWTDPEYILEPLTPQRQPEVVVDNENTLHVVGQYSNPQGGGEVLYTRKPLNGDWTIPEIIRMYGAAARPDLAVDNGGNIHIVWVELVGPWPVFYAKKAHNGSWSTPVQISTDDAFPWSSPEIVVDLQGYAHVVWTASTQEPSSLNWMTYTTNAQGDTWSSPTVVALDSALGIGSPTIAVDNERTIHVAWSQNRNISYTFKFTDTQWNAPTSVCSNSTVSEWPCLVTDNAGVLHLVWSEVISELYYATKDTGSDWSEPDVYQVTLYSMKMALSTNTLGIVFSTHSETDTLLENYEIFFVEVPKK
ncbi:hypothetical protein IBX73_11290 [candidate division WOR-3 bacterium]|nr:hypothetical protein [candidate division WOR-3 bacterium]